MKKKKKIKLNKKPLIFLGAFLLIGIIGGTFAYYYTEVVIPNEFKAMKYNVGLREEFAGDWGTKKVYIENKEEKGTPVVLRLNYNEVWKKTITEGSNTIELVQSNTYNGANVATKNWTTVFVNDFVYDPNDGWYYYKKLLNGEETIQILESISKSFANQQVEDAYQGYHYELSFNYEAIQGTVEAVSDIWGKTVTISQGGDVTWPS